MGFWGTLGKGLLKAAPIAASFIPGVGPIASGLIGAATGAAGGAMGGGGVKGAITGGAMGGLGGYGAGKMQQGLGPSPNFQGPNLPGGGGGWQQKLGNVLGGGGFRMPTGINGPLGQEGQNPGMGGYMQQLMQQMQNRGGGPYNEGINERASMRRGEDIRVPNLRNPLEQGRREGLARGPRQDRLRRQTTMY